MNTQCPECKKEINMINSYFYLLPDCEHRVCNACFDKETSSQQLSKDGKKKFKCKTCNKDKQVTVDFQRKINVLYTEKFTQDIDRLKQEMEKLREEQHSVTEKLRNDYKKLQNSILQEGKQKIFECQSHENKEILFLCKKDQNFLCVSCMSLHVEHFTQILEFNSQQIFSHTERLIQLLEKLKLQNLEKITQIELDLQDQIQKIQKETQEKIEKLEYDSQQNISQVQNDISVIEEKIEKSQIINDVAQYVDTDFVQQEFLFIEKLLNENLSREDHDQFSKISLFYNSPSKILNELKKWQLLLKQMFPTIKDVELIFRGSRDGFTAASFHQKCDNTESLLFLVKSKTNRIFGAYSDIPLTFSFSNTYVGLNKKSFLISFREDGNFMKLIHKQHQEVCQNSSYMGVFGNSFGWDLCIFNNCNTNNSSYSNLGYSYDLPKGITVNSDESKQFLSGSYNFSVEEYEVFRIQF